MEWSQSRDEHSLENKNLLLEELRHGYENTWNNKSILEDKAIKLTSISSIMGAIVFGFGSVLFSNSSIVDLFHDESWINVNLVFGIFTVSVILALGSVILSLKVILPQNYIFIIGNKNKNELREGNLKTHLENIYLKELWYDAIEINIRKFMEDYINAISNNFSSNETKGRYVKFSFFALTISMAFVVLDLFLIGISLIL
ncbi:MAG: hypothetical protein AB7V56_06920 [Candidatus Nitrosocosmicus sp.]